jgi:hypothetical protein
MASTMNTHSITVDLPQAIFDSVDRVARATHRSPEAVVKTMLAHALPPLDDVAPEEADALLRWPYSMTLHCGKLPVDNFPKRAKKSYGRSLTCKARISCLPINS